MGEMLKGILHHKGRIIRVIVVIAVLIAIIIVAGAQYVITLDDGICNEENPSNTPGCVSKHIKETAFGDSTLKTLKLEHDRGYALDIDLDAITDKVIEDLNENDGRLGVYISWGNEHDYLKRMIKAEYITQYPDLRSTKAREEGDIVPEYEFQGIIQFIRHKNNGSTQLLEYIELGNKEGLEEDTFYGLLNRANGKGEISDTEIQQAREKILNYFSVDKKGNVVVSNVEETITKNAVGQYDTEYVGDGEEDYAEEDRSRLNDVTKDLTFIPLGIEDNTGPDTLYGLVNRANGRVQITDATTGELRNMTPEEIKEVKDLIFTLFSRDENGNIIVAVSNRTEDSSEDSTDETIEDSIDGSAEDSLDEGVEDIKLVTISENASSVYSEHLINYKSLVSKYTMPFNYLWAFLVCGRDEEFVKDLADLVLESKIEISIYDNLTEIEETSINAYNDNEWESTRVSTRDLVDGVVDGSENIGGWSEASVAKTAHKYQVDYMKTRTNSILTTVTNLDIWYMKYFANYTYEVEDPEEEKSIRRLADTPLKETMIKSGEWTTVSSHTNVINNTTIPPTTITIEEQEKTDVKIQNNSNQSTFTQFYHTVKYKYTFDGVPEVIEKTDPNLKEGDEGYPNFCTLYSNSQAAYGNIYSAPDWLFTILESNINTVNLVELTKYLMYCATGISYGVKEFDFGILYPTILVKGLYGGTVEEQIWFALLDAGYSKEAAAGVLGNLQQESGIRPNNLQNSYEESLGMNDEQYTSAVDSGGYTNFINDSAGYGLAQWTSDGRKNGLYLYAQDLGVSISDSSMQIEYLLGEICPSGGANGRAHFQMATSRGGYSYESWVGASTPEEAAVAFCRVFERAGDAQLDNRRRYAREFYDKYRDLEQGDIAIGTIELTGEMRVKMEAMLNEAVRIANDDRYGYSQPLRDSEFYYDCSSFVKRLYTEFFGISVPSNTREYSSYSSYNIGIPSTVDLQPGDVLWRTGHVIMYIGNGNYVAASTDEVKKPDQIKVYQANTSDYTRVYRFIGS